MDLKLPRGKFLAKGSWVWYLKATYGLPIGYTFEWLKNHEAVPDWIDLINSAIQDGMKPVKAVDLICYEVAATWGPEEAKNVKGILYFAIEHDRMNPLWDQVKTDQPASDPGILTT